MLFSVVAVRVNESIVILKIGKLENFILVFNWKMGDNRLVFFIKLFYSFLHAGDAFLIEIYLRYKVTSFIKCYFFLCVDECLWKQTTKLNFFLVILQYNHKTVIFDKLTWLTLTSFDREKKLLNNYWPICCINVFSINN